MQFITNLRDYASSKIKLILLCNILVTEISGRQKPKTC